MGRAIFGNFLNSVLALNAAAGYIHPLEHSPTTSHILA
jgi:hypothetical protein